MERKGRKKGRKRRTWLQTGMKTPFCTALILILEALILVYFRAWVYLTRSLIMAHIYWLIDLCHSLLTFQTLLIILPNFWIMLGNVMVTKNCQSYVWKNVSKKGAEEAFSFRLWTKKFKCDINLHSIWIKLLTFHHFLCQRMWKMYTNPENKVLWGGVRYYGIGYLTFFWQ